MHSQLLLPIASLKRNPPLMWNFSMTGNLRCFKLYRTHVNIKLDYKSDEEWYEMMKYAFEVYERLNIQLYVRK